MNTLLQAFARLPEAEPESHWIAYSILIGASLVAGFLFGRWAEYRRAYNTGYLAGFREGLTAHEGDISCPVAPTIKISPRPVKSPFTVSREGDLARDMGWQNSKDIY